MISKSTIGVCAGVAGGLFVGYCIYFDKKRRSDPDFKKKLREKRQKGKKGPSSSANVKWPNFKDQEAVQEFFLSQLETGEELLGRGEVESGVAHMSRAVAVSGQPQQLLQVMQQILPPQAFQMLIAQLPAVSKSIMEASRNSSKEPKITEIDLE